MNESYYYEGKIAEYELERSEHYWLIPVVPMLWYGFQTFRNEITMIANCTDQPHHPMDLQAFKNFAAAKGLSIMGAISPSTPIQTHP